MMSLWCHRGYFLRPTVTFNLYSYTLHERALSSHTDLVRRCRANYSASIISRLLFWWISDELSLVGLCVAARHHGAEETRWCETWHAHCCREAGDAYFTGRQTILRVSPVTCTLGRAAVVESTLQLCAPQTRLLKSSSSETWNSFTFHAFSCRLGAV